MASRIYIDPQDVWDYYKENFEYEDPEIVLIAENEDYGIEISLSDDDGTALITVEQDGMVIEEECFMTKADCCKTVEDFYDLYLTESIFSLDSFSDKNDRHDYEIEDREDDLNDAFSALLSEILDVSVISDEIKEILEDVKDHTIEYIARKHKKRIRRPMYLEDETGEPFFEEYPYGKIIFDDDNPIYKA